MDQKEIDARFERARARNRAAQLRFRQRAQEEREALEQKGRHVEKAIAAAHNRHAELQRQRVSRSTRVADAAAALATVRAQQSKHAASTAHTPGGPPLDPLTSGTYIPISSSLAYGTGADPVHSHPSGHASDTGARIRPSTAGAAWSLIQSKRCPRVLRAPLYQPPRHIAAFRSSTGISYEDLRAAADPAARLVDFSQHALADLAERVCARKAAQLQLPSADVCWFVQTEYQVAEGARLSVSASISSPECTAAFALHYLISRLEMTLITAAASHAEYELHQRAGGASDHGNGVDLCDDSCAVKEDTQPTKTARPQPPPPTGAHPHGGARTLSKPPGSSGHARAPTLGDVDPPAAAAHSAPEAEDPGWSSRVRVGVGQTFDADAAVHTILQRLLRTFCQQIPLPVLYRLLESYHAVLARMQSGFSAARWKAGGEAVPHSAHARSSEDLRAYMARATAAGRGATRVFVDVLDALTDMHVLRRMEAHGPAGPLPWNDITPELNLEEYAHVAVAACALLQHRALLSAPRIVMNMSFYGTHVLSRLDEEIDSFHVCLYRQLKFTEDDHSRLVAHLRAWKQHSTALDAPFHAALATLERLPQATDTPPALVARISAAAAGESARNAGTVHEVHANTGAGDDAVEGRWSSALRMLGACAKETADAERGLLGLKEVHEAHGRVRRETKELQMQPGVLLRPLQIAHVWSAHILWCAAQADTIKLCQLATAQQRWRDLASLSSVIVKQQPPPQLPEYQWFEGTVEAAGSSVPV